MKPILLFNLWIPLSLICQLSLAMDEQIADGDFMDLSIEELLKVEVVSIATGTVQPVTIAPATTSVITMGDMAITAAQEVDEILETIPGLHVARNPASYYNPIYALGSIYSIYNPETLVLLNGVPTNTLYTGGRVLMGYGGLSTTPISRIEVIRGPGSALYGADALAGVINIITKTKADIEGTSAGIRLGSFESYEGWLLHGSQYQGLDIGFSLNYNQTQGQDEIVLEDAQTQYDKIYGTQASLSPGTVDLSRRNWDIDLSIAKGFWSLHTFYQKRDNIDPGVGVAQTLTTKGQSSSDRVYTDMVYDNPNLTENWAFMARASYSDVSYLTEDNAIVYPPGAFGGAFPVGMRAVAGVAEQQLDLSVSATYRGIQQHQLRLGTGFRYNEINEVTDKRNFGINPATNQPIPPTIELVDISDTSAAFIPAGDRRNWHVFAQDIWTLHEKWEMTTGLRYDYYSDFGTTLNPRIGLVWHTAEHLVTKLLYGKAFRAPSFQELYQTNNPVALGNKDLKPEKIQMWEIALDYRPSEKWHLGFNTFTYDLKDKILFVPDIGDENYHAQNAGTQKGYGFVLEGGWQLGEDFVLSGNYAYQRSENEFGHEVAQVPQQDVYLRTDWRFTADWYINTQANWILGRERALDDPRAPVDDYLSVDLSLHYKSTVSPWQMTFSIYNLFDADIREPSSGPDESGIINVPYDLPMAGRHYSMGFAYRF